MQIRKKLESQTDIPCTVYIVPGMIFPHVPLLVFKLGTPKHKKCAPLVFIWQRKVHIVYLCTVTAQLYITYCLKKERKVQFEYFFPDSVG